MFCSIYLLFMMRPFGRMNISVEQCVWLYIHHVITVGKRFYILFLLSQILQLLFYFILFNFFILELAGQYLLSHLPFSVHLLLTTTQQRRRKRCCC